MLHIILLVLGLAKVVDIADALRVPENRTRYKKEFLNGVYEACELAREVKKHCQSDASATASESHEPKEQQ